MRMAETTIAPRTNKDISLSPGSAEMSALKDVKREHMGTPQIILLVFIGLRLLLESNKHGLARTDKHNVFYALIDAIFLLIILYSGGFFG